MKFRRFSPPLEGHSLHNQLNRLVGDLEAEIAQLSKQIADLQGQQAPPAPILQPPAISGGGAPSAGTVIPAGPPGPSDPSNLAVGLDSKADLKLTWAYPSPIPAGFDHFEIWYNTVNDLPSATYLDRSSSQEYVLIEPLGPVAPFVSGVTYYFFLIAFNSAGVIDSTPAETSYTMPFVPDVTGLTAKVTSKRDVQLQWQPVSFTGFSGYLIYRGLTFAGAVFVGDCKQAQYLVTDPSAGSNTYWVVVKDNSGIIDANPASVSVTVFTLPDPINLTAIITKKNDIQLSWQLPAVAAAPSVPVTVIEEPEVEVELQQLRLLAELLLILRAILFVFCVAFDVQYEDAVDRGQQ